MRITRNMLVRGQGQFGVEPKIMPYGRIKTFPGLDGIEAVVDASMPSDKMHFVLRGCLGLNGGTKTQAIYPDHDKDS